MANRGRGTLVIRTSTNPFFQPSSRADDTDYDCPILEREAPPLKKIEDGFDFGFLYRRANDDIGEGIGGSDSRLSEIMAKGPTLAEIANLKSGAKTALPCPCVTEAPLSPTNRAEAILDVYRHEPKPENPMYQTTNNQLGIEPPSVATLTAERKARSQQFSNSFNGIQVKDHGLNTSLVRSRVHNALDFF